MRACAESPSGPALGYCQGTPLRNELESRAPGRLPELTAHAAQAIAARFGVGLFGVDPARNAGDVSVLIAHDQDRTGDSGQELASIVSCTAWMIFA